MLGASKAFHKASYTWFVFLLAFAAVVPMHGCITDEGLSVPNVLSTEDEIALGDKLSAEVESKAKILQDPAIQNYVRGIGERLARQSPRQDVPYRFTVIDDPKTVNAFALPGGHMYIYTGLLGMCSNEAELASVMGHELGHVTAHHHGQAITREQIFGGLVSVALGRNPSASAEAVTQIGTSLIQLRFSRGQEREADRFGMDFTFRAGYKPDAMIDFMRKMQANEQQQGGGPGLTMLSSHPATDERIADLEALVQQYPEALRAKSPVYRDRYRSNVLNRLK